MNSGQNVLEAVRTNGITNKQGFLQKLFAVWFDAFVYNQIWEDPRVDLQALQLNEKSRVLTISSGGCNALNYLVENPESITAVDLNRYHIYLLRLKLAALQFLPTYEDFFGFYGFGKHAENVANYYQFIALNLSENTREFWEGNGFFGKLFYGGRINYFVKGGLYEHSRNGYFLRVFHRFSQLSGCRPDEVLNARTLAEQERLYEKNIAPFFDSCLIKIVGKMPVTMFGLGIPPQQYDELKKDLDERRTVIDIYRERAKRLACAFPIQENYFAWQAFARKYDTENRCAVPEYLKAENHENLKSNVHKITTNVGSVTEQIQQNRAGTFNRFVFLDAQDWMNAATMTELWQAISEKAEKGSRIIFRTAGAASPIEKNLPKRLQSKFSYQKNYSAELFEQDRASIYGGFHLYTFE
ncbi:MAG: BtaA family protein [Pyrinomonadaceae bacterium]|nr:BtaA family protein [Pyrinomonadaceae bacterium]